MDAPTIVALGISLAAFAASLTSLWKSVLKPARIAIDLLDHRVAGGSSGHDVPSIYEMSLGLAISNEGARAGVLTRIDFANVESVGLVRVRGGNNRVRLLPADDCRGRQRETPRPAEHSCSGRDSDGPNQLQAEGCCLHGGWHDASAGLDAARRWLVQSSGTTT